MGKQGTYCKMTDGENNSLSLHACMCVCVSVTRAGTENIIFRSFDHHTHTHTHTLPSPLILSSSSSRLSFWRIRCAHVQHEAVAGDEGGRESSSFKERERERSSDPTTTGKRIGLLNATPAPIGWAVESLTQSSSCQMFASSPPPPSLPPSLPLSSLPLSLLPPTCILHFLLSCV